MMSRNEYNGHRGSNSKLASNYKKQGHKDEEEFASLINGKVISGSQKVDVIGPNGTSYSCKGGAKNWQILLYSESNFNDSEWSDLGTLFKECLDCFPSDYSIYAQDKKAAKNIIYSYLRKKSGKDVYNHVDAMELNPQIKKDIKDSLRNNHLLLKDLMGLKNTYLNAKCKLQLVTTKIRKKFEEKGQIKSFLEKGMFDNNNVEKLVVKEGDNFLVFSKSDILNIFELNLEVSNSVAGHGIDDINLDGQKIIMKYKTNIIELEIRNDASVYRQVRFNMKRQKAIDLFKLKTRKVNSPYDQVICYERK